jgi:hypothetical protein
MKEILRRQNLAALSRQVSPASVLFVFVAIAKGLANKDI